MAWPVRQVEQIGALAGGTGRMLAGALPNCQLEVIEGAGHYWVFGEFDLVLDTLRRAWPE